MCVEGDGGPRPARRARRPRVDLAPYPPKLLARIIDATEGYAALYDGVREPVRRPEKVLTLGQVAAGSLGIDVTSGQSKSPSKQCVTRYASALKLSSAGAANPLS
jgi:hypothetical protein